MNFPQSHCFSSLHLHLQLLCSGLLHGDRPSGRHHREHCLWQAGGHKLRRPDPAGVDSAPHRRTCGPPPPANQADGAHLMPEPLCLCRRGLQLPYITPSSEGSETLCLTVVPCLNKKMKREI